MSKSWVKLGVFLLTLVAVANILPARAQSVSVPAQTPDDIVLGKSEAPITIFEYASLACPHCADFDQNTLPQIKKEWVDTGKARLIFRDFPLDQPALHGAILAHCASPDEFYAFIDLLFGNQDTWAHAGDINAVDAALSKLGILGGVTQEKFNACLDDKDLTTKILDSRLQANKQYGVEATPTFIVNGRKVGGALPYAEFNKVLTDAAAPKP